MVEVQVLVLVQQAEAHPLDDGRAGASDPHELRALAGVATLGDRERSRGVSAEESEGRPLTREPA